MSQKEPTVTLPFEGTGLLEGEDPDTAHAGDARHWISIYQELLGFKDSLIARSVIELGRLSLPAQAELGSGDLRALRDQRQRWQSRLDFWYDRYWDLHGLELDLETHAITYKGASVHMTAREFQLISLLLANPGRSFPARRLVQEAWHDPRLSSEQLRLYIVRVRRRLKELGVPCAVVNTPHRGYSMVWSLDGAGPPGV
jgi:hypothetical protein